ncbi:zincin-like metallopeptidase domain-containing protein [Bhargavaea ginsengi]|uniref:ArdC family protein n=1 Tax=Bhargavaea ginsengi TaxID=426757 RepID=UPI00204265A8|nr:zincin-like metallopeptidase domain-containing protein [Bhargavaea ginsengi]MCM3089154.1 zincin-like metallopeptidase domain-containing protein [Bhargavaea ginsengi]
MKKSVYEIVTAKIIEQLEKGVVPWRQPWASGGAVNWKTQKPYRGINTFLLEPGEYATFKQIQEAGGKVKKGAESHIVVFWKWLEKENEETGEPEKIPYLRYYRVFEINKQAEGLESRRCESAFDHDPIEEAEEVVKGYLNGPTYSYRSGRAYYQPARDHINVPPLKDYRDAAGYYSTLFHEMVHSTGHRSRLARPGVTRQEISFGDEVYSKEELVAEMGAAMLCGVAGIENETIENSASYLQSWLRALKEDSRLIVQAAAQAQKAADYILGHKLETE